MPIGRLYCTTHRTFVDAEEIHEANFTILPLFENKTIIKGLLVFCCKAIF